VSFRWNALCVDCSPASFDAVVAFYSGLLGLPVIEREDRWAALRPEGTGVGINVQAEDWYVAPVWPEVPGTQAKMLHLEIEVADVDAAVAQAIDLGAREAAPQPADRDPALLRVMLDPAGHPFCLWS
jgi:catechol 2,3-dioxygenase-like lactoylglutathione lyase family enzyme